MKIEKMTSVAREVLAKKTGVVVINISIGNNYFTDEKIESLIAWSHSVDIKPCFLILDMMEIARLILTKQQKRNTILKNISAIVQQKKDLIKRLMNQKGISGSISAQSDYGGLYDIEYENLKDNVICSYYEKTYGLYLKHNIDATASEYLRKLDLSENQDKHNFIKRALFSELTIILFVIASQSKQKVVVLVWHFENQLYKYISENINSVKNAATLGYIVLN